jgi:dTDP-glucose 4,6-dehydratase
MKLHKGKRCLVTGGAGFIGSAFIRYGLRSVTFCEKIVNLDLLTYAGNLTYLTEIEKDPRYTFVHGDIADMSLVESICHHFQIDTIVHFAAETHVDRSIEGPDLFCKTNVTGTLQLLEVIRRNPAIHFHHISTDEVYGSLGGEGYFTEESSYHPNSPYAASKAASDHFVRAYAHTYRLATTISHCSNNYGPCQHPEKFIPRMIQHCLSGEPLPVFGKGENIREWLYVDDHAEAVWSILEKGRVGETYNIGGGDEMRNIDLLHLLIREMSFLAQMNRETLEKQISFVQDRPGHDLRYAIDSSKIKSELGWMPRHELKTGIRKTIEWYLSFYAMEKQVSCSI